MKRSLFPKQKSVANESSTNDRKHDQQSNNNDFSQIHDVTLDYLRQMETNSEFFACNVPRRIPQFAPREVNLGVMLGQGEFGVLLRVQGIQLQVDDDEGAICSSPPLDHHHRLVSSSINLPAFDSLQLHGDERDIYDIHTFSTTKSGSMKGSMCNDSFSYQDLSDGKKLASLTQPPPHHRVTQSVTISKLAHPPPLPIEQRARMSTHSVKQQRTASVVATKGERDEDEALRKSLAQQTGSSSSNPNSPSFDEKMDVRMNGRRLALKQVRKDLYPKKKLEAAKDLAREAKFLAQLDHDNIITLRGVVSQPGQLEFGMLLDRLGVTLAEEVTKWHKREQELLAANHVPVVTPVLEAFSSLFQQKSETPVTPFSHDNTQHYTQPSLQLLGERVLALWDMARGMEYLHKHKILFRDLKTENVGTLLVNNIAKKSDEDLWQQQQRMQIFDFGLAKECKQADCVKASEIEGGYYNSYHMTGLTGTLRVMAPEVIQCLPYGLPADVFSFGVCMWEVFSGTNNNGLTAGETCKGQRPDIPTMDRNSGVGMPSALQWLLKRCWAQDPQRRPTFCDIERQLHSQLLELQRVEIQPKSSRSSSRSASPLNFVAPDVSPTQNAGLSNSAVWKRLETIHSSNALDEQGGPLISVTDS